ncbi:hypothetical protein [Paenibacillus durus]|uniref:hypothetical protein n=1 Tax=Paenibacillus durus TaxID=44251 RepID=UPI0012E07F86|nr:hypothetical protein [Paenibacillus durus]
MSGCWPEPGPLGQGRGPRAARFCGVRGGRLERSLAGAGRLDRDTARGRHAFAGHEAGGLSARWPGQAAWAGTRPKQPSEAELCRTALPLSPEATSRRGWRTLLQPLRIVSCPCCIKGLPKTAGKPIHEAEILPLIHKLQRTFIR